MPLYTKLIFNCKDSNIFQLNTFFCNFIFTFTENNINYYKNVSTEQTINVMLLKHAYHRLAVRSVVYV